MNLFPILSFNRILPTPCGPHFWNLRAPFASNILLRPVILETNSLVVFFGKHYMHRSHWTWEKSSLLFVVNVTCFSAGINTIMGERQPSESTLQLASRFWKAPSIKLYIFTLVLSNSAEQTSLSYHPLLRPHPMLKEITFSYCQNQRQAEMSMQELVMHRIPRKWSDKTLRGMLTPCGIHQSWH